MKYCRLSDLENELVNQSVHLVKSNDQENFHNLYNPAHSRSCEVVRNPVGTSCSECLVTVGWQIVSTCPVTYIDIVILCSVKKKRSSILLMIISPYLTFNMFNNKRCTNFRSCIYLFWTPFIYSTRKVTLYKSNKLNKIDVEFV